MVSTLGEKFSKGVVRQLGMILFPFSSCRFLFLIFFSFSLFFFFLLLFRMFHMLADDTGASAVWVAQRVPEDHITAVANQFVIGQIDLKDNANFMASGE